MTPPLWARTPGGNSEEHRGRTSGTLLVGSSSVCQDYSFVGPGPRWGGTTTQRRPVPGSTCVDRLQYPDP